MQLPHWRHTKVTVIWGLLGLSFLVFFHETGHFIVAILCGVKVEAFSIGMGPVLLHHKWGDTDYRLSLIPIGGYCGMKGEHDYQDALSNNMKEIKGDSDSFYGVHPFKRLLIAFAGPFFNLIFSIIAFVIIAFIGYTYYAAGTTVSMTTDTEEYKDIPSPAKEAGMQSGDKILSINGKEMSNFSDIAIYVGTHGDENVTITVERDGIKEDIKVHIALDKETGAGKLGIVSMKDSYTECHYGPYSFFPAIYEGTKQAFSMLTVTVKSIGILFKGIDITKAVSGPARITTMLGDRVQEGFSQGVKTGVIGTLELLALISISLFITNLLPVPVLDGGLILFALIEWIAHKKMHPKLLYYIQFIGIAFIAAMFALAIVGDLRYFIFTAR